MDWSIGCIYESRDDEFVFEGWSVRTSYRFRTETHFDLKYIINFPHICLVLFILNILSPCSILGIVAMLSRYFTSGSLPGRSCRQRNDTRLYLLSVTIIGKIIFIQYIKFSFCYHFIVTDFVSVWSTSIFPICFLD